MSAVALARQRNARGVQLHDPEAVARISDDRLEAARDDKTMPEAMDVAMAILTRTDVMAGVAEMLNTLQIEAMALDGMTRVTGYDPIRDQDRHERCDRVTSAISRGPSSHTPAGGG